MLSETAINQRDTSQVLQASVDMLNVKDCDSTNVLDNTVRWACFKATIPAVIESTMESSVYQSILESDLLLSFIQLKLGTNCQQDNDPKQRKSTLECVKKKIIKVLQRSSQSPDLNLTEMLWWDLRRAVHTLMPANLS